MTVLLNLGDRVVSKAAPELTGTIVYADPEAFGWLKARNEMIAVHFDNMPEGESILCRIEYLARLYQCDVCQQMKPSCQLISAYGMDTIACDECRGYDPKDYGEDDADPS